VNNVLTLLRFALTLGVSKALVGIFLLAIELVKSFDKKRG
jgi:hypothetical protein